MAVTKIELKSRLQQSINGVNPTDKQQLANLLGAIIDGVFEIPGLSDTLEEILTNGNTTTKQILFDGVANGDGSGAKAIGRSGSTFLIQIGEYGVNDLSITNDNGAFGEEFIYFADDTVQLGRNGATLLSITPVSTTIGFEGINKSILIDGSRTTIQDSIISVPNVPSFDDDAAAGVGGLVTGDIYQTTGLGAAPLNAAGIVMVKQ